MISTDEDKILIQKSLENKQEFAKLIDKYEGAISRYLRRIGIYEKEDAQDCLQNIFIKVYINLNSYDPDFPFSNWLYRIAYNETMTYLKKKNRIKIIFYDDDNFDFKDDLDLLKIQESKQNKIIISEFLQNLREDYREVLILKYMEDKSYEEIAYILKKPEGTIATLINRGKKELKEMLKNKGIQNI